MNWKKHPKGYIPIEVASKNKKRAKTGGRHMSQEGDKFFSRMALATGNPICPFDFLAHQGKDKDISNFVARISEKIGPQSHGGSPNRDTKKNHLLVITFHINA